MVEIWWKDPRPISFRNADLAFQTCSEITWLKKEVRLTSVISNKINLTHVKHYLIYIIKTSFLFYFNIKFLVNFGSLDQNLFITELRNTMKVEVKWLYRSMIPRFSENFSPADIRSSTLSRDCCIIIKIFFQSLWDTINETKLSSFAP